MKDKSFILFNKKRKPYSLAHIRNKINRFGNSYNNAVKDIIELSTTLDQEGEIFIQCAARILTNFKMTEEVLLKD